MQPRIAPGNEFDTTERTCIAELVSELKARQGLFDLEQKSRQSLRILAGPTWSPWKRTRAFTATGPAKLAVSVLNHNNGRMKGPYFLRIRHVVPGGRLVTSHWQSHGGISGNGPYPMAAGIQELEISARAPLPYPQDLTVYLDWAR